MKNKVVVAVTQNVNEDGTTHILPTYLDALISVGAKIKLVPYTKNIEELRTMIEECNGVCLTGGADIDPKRYGEEKTCLCGKTCDNQDILDLTVFQIATELNKPTVGICRGAQLINVALGGTLYQNIPTEISTSILHSQNEPKFEHSHEINITPSTPLYNLLGKERIKANSFHHRAIKSLGEGISVMAIADDGVIEAIYSPNYKYLRAYQWHPERICQND